MSNKFDRNSACSMDLSDGSGNTNDEVQYLIPLQDSLYAFANSFITRIMLAESIDPQNLFPETRHSNQKLYSIGCDNSLVARSIIQTKQILDSIILNPEINNKKVLDHAWCCTEMLLKCESVHHKIYQETLELIPKCDAIIEEGKKRTNISSLPQVSELEDNIAIFLGNAKRFLEKTHEFLCLFYGAPDSGSNFKSYREWLAKNKTHNKVLIKLLEDDKSWIKHIADMRNAHGINHAKPGFNVEVVNFQLDPDNKCSAPGWRYDFSGDSGATQMEYSDVVTDMHICLANLLTFFEELLLTCIIDSSDDNYSFKIYKKSPEAIDAKCPSIYFVSIDKDI